MSMQRELAKGRFRYIVSGRGNDPEVNTTLCEKLRRDFNLVLPVWSEDDQPESYWAKVEGVIETRKGWQVMRWLTVGTFPFAKMSMFADLDPAVWPEGALLDHFVVQDVLLGRDPEGLVLEERDVDSPLFDEIAPLLI